MYLSVKDVKALDSYKLLLTFENGEVRLFDMKPYLNKGIFKELKDRSMFKSVKVSFDTIEWENEADIDPETLYEDSVPYN
ncbi:DUF2442 domain-containing protein [Clostridium botulinum]|uniref:DUF2442 domain-containing protein n=1 Tax=Clostridium sp. cpc1 TaxID=2016536 RepID=UPI0005F907F7|nr:DUF2442 domain-containing protein [Clostridium sp. cpc1]MCW7999474.1 DUF2442 domain-containing protein [Clostridium sp. cpc1]MDU5010628.1 DUF2442 domain-containing protein [Clostridium botulinum]